MTAPVPDWMSRHDERALKFEQQAHEQTSLAMRLALADAARRLAAQYIKVAGGLAAPLPPGAKDDMRVTVRRVLAALATAFVSELPAAIRALREVVAAGLRLGSRSAPSRARRAQLRASEELAAAIDDLQARVRRDAAAARKYAAQANVARYSDVLTVVAKAQQVVNQVESTARWVANRAVNEGAAAVADAAGVPRLWISFRDACPTCLRYSGELAPSGEPFPAGLTYGDRSTVTAPIYAPPAHPSCRCRVVPWFGTEPQFGVQLPQALTREAQRSVLRGASEYASRPEKLRAVDRLLKAGTSGLPETVKLRARRLVAAGPQAFRPAKRTPRP